MKMKSYDKLVRDRIPEIMEGLGKKFVVRTLSDEEFATRLTLKLREETEEFAASGDISELADILEVIHGILDHRGTGFEELETLRIRKKGERGGFSKRILLAEGETN